MKSARGFTLVEVIIAASLASLVMLGIISAVRTFGTSLTKAEDRVERIDEMRLASEYLRQLLQTVVSDLHQPLPDGTLRVYYQGEAQHLQFLTDVPPRHGLGGMSLVDLSLAANGDDSDLVMRVVPWVPQPERMAALDDARPEILIPQVTALQWRYRHPETGEWSEQWADPDKVPDAVRLDIARSGQAWPPLIVRLQPLGATP